MPLRFELQRTIYDDIVVEDVEHNIRFMTLNNGEHQELAEKVVDYLNSLPPEQTLLYPYD